MVSFHLGNDALDSQGQSIGDAFQALGTGLSEWANSPSVSTLVAVPKQSKWVLDPRTSKLMTSWDVISVVALLYTALMTPFEVAFVNSFGTELFVNDKGQYAYELGVVDMPDDDITFWWFVGRVLDAIFLIDLFLQVRGQRFTHTVPLVARMTSHIVSRACSFSSRTRRPMDNGSRDRILLSGTTCERGFSWISCHRCR